VNANFPILVTFAGITSDFSPVVWKEDSRRDETLDEKVTAFKLRAFWKAQVKTKSTVSGMV